MNLNYIKNSNPHPRVLCIIDSFSDVECWAKLGKHRNPNRRMFVISNNNEIKRNHITRGWHSIWINLLFVTVSDSKEFHE